MSGEAFLADDGNVICERSDLPMAWCAHCKGLIKPPPRHRTQYVPLGPVEQAAQSDHCAGCGRRYWAFDDVKWDETRNGFLAMACCSHRRPRRKRAA